jgi:hemoglobin-like flavoprotein
MEKGPMTNEQVEIVKRTLVRLIPPRPEGTSETVLQRFEKIKFEAYKAFGDTFYDHLFEIAPDTKALFKDVEATKQKFPDMLALLCRSMNRMHDTLNTMQELGVTHWKAGVKIEHYQPFVASILWTFKTKLGDEIFTAYVAEAFIAVLARICGIMCNAAYPEARFIDPAAPLPVEKI